MKTYCVEYKMYFADDVHKIDVLAKSRFEAYDKAVFEVIPKEEGSTPYSAWVESVTYSNGNHKRFNTFEGNAY